MPLSQNDRLSFSLQIAQAATKISSLQGAQDATQSAMAQVQSLDDGNNNLFSPVNALVNLYQNEIQYLDGNQRTSIIEQDVQDAAKKKIQNHFFPNDTSVTVPSLSGSRNIWTFAPPFALNFGLGKNYSEAYTTITSEITQINTIISLINSASANQDIENTSGEHAFAANSCSLPEFGTKVACEAGGGTWFASDTILSFPAVQTLKTNLVSAVTALQAILNNEAAALTANTDTNSSNVTQNQAALANINTVILPALTAWLAFADFNPPSVSGFAAFYAFNSSTLAPTKLHSTQLNNLKTALNTRVGFANTRAGQINTILGTIVQNVTSGAITSSTGFYGKRYTYLALRLNSLSGSLAQLSGMQTSAGAQGDMIGNINGQINTYKEILPTSLLQANGNGTPMISVIDSTFLNVGDSVYVTAEGQDELKRAVKDKSGSRITLNDVIPAKYTTDQTARIYKDLS